MSSFDSPILHGNTESGSLRRPIAMPAGLHRLIVRTLVARSFSSSLGGRKNALRSSLPPSVPQRGYLLLFPCDKRSKNTSAFFDFGDSKKPEPKKTHLRFCSEFLRLLRPSLCSGERIGYFSTHNRDAKVAEIAKTAARISQLSAGCPEVRFRKISPRDAPVCDCGFFFSSPCLRCSLRDRLVQHRCSERFRQF